MQHTRWEPVPCMPATLCFHLAANSIVCQEDVLYSGL